MPVPWGQTLISASTSGAAIVANSSTDLYPGMDYTFLPQFFQIGTKLAIHASGVASTTGSTETMLFAVKMGSSVVNQAFGTITFLASQTNQKWWLDIDLECRASGAGTSTTFVATGLFRCSTALLAVCTQMLPASGAIAVGTGVDGTATQVMGLYGTWGAINNSLTVEQYEVVLVQS